MSLFYIAFVSRLRKSDNICRLRLNNVSNKLEPDCMRELEMQMLSLMITKSIIQQILEVGVPFVTNLVSKRASKSRKQGDSTSSSRYIQELKLPSYPSTVRDYAEMVIQFGYLVLFGVAFPLSAVISFVNNIIEVRTDAFKILKVSQRVNADKAADIGAWYTILRMLTVVGVLTNAGILVFTAETANNLFSSDGVISHAFKVLCFFLLVNSLLVARKLIEIMINDVPAATKRRLARQKYEIARHFNVGWEDAFRGNALLKIEGKEIEDCKRYEDEFHVASDIEVMDEENENYNVKIE